jgi:lipopolysaccharide/colanic/teichoic acid biosynthesis glycosyltransferase
MMMTTGWRYRLASVLGTVWLTGAAIVVVNAPPVQSAFARVPIFGRPAPAVLGNGELAIAIVTAVAVIVAVMWPLYRPRPRRILDTIALTQRRVLLAMVGLAAMGYFDYSYRLPRSTLMLSTLVLLVGLPAWHLLIRRRPQGTSRSVIVGDDPEAMADILEATDLPVVGYVSPPSRYGIDDEIATAAAAATDGGHARSLDELANLGDLYGFDKVLVEHNIDTAVLAFAGTERAEFFGTLDTCHRHGVTTLVHRDHIDSVLTAGGGGGDLVEVDLEPWDWQDHVLKTVFDTVFSIVGLVVLSPVMAAIAVAIKLEDGGPILYRQERTAEFGETITVYKFRSMAPESEDVEPGEETDRVTDIGQFLRRTHLDEIPQLWSILRGEMSVVGPRAAWTDEELLLEEEVSEWPQRWFVKPGLTGLAQINGATSEDPHQKLRYDIEYIRRQSFWYDLKIVVRQVWTVLEDIVATIWNPQGER